MLSLNKKHQAVNALGIALLLVAMVVGTLALFSAPIYAQEDLSAETIYEQVSPSVVSISVSTGQGGGNGTGFVYDQAGHIVTNFHVVDEAEDVVVAFVDGTQVRADVIGLDADSDLAVLQVDVAIEKLQPVSLGDSDAVRVGEDVYAIGSPFGQRWTLTRGIISAVDRTIRGLDQFSIGGVLQTDAAINPGNSGGPLLNARGEVIGVNSQILSNDRSNSGIGFSIPINLTERVVNTLIEQGFVEYSYLGIVGGDVSISVIEAFGLPNDFQGVVVDEVAPGGPAARAGLQDAVFIREGNDDNPMDATISIESATIITTINGESLTGMSDLIGYLARETQPGDTITLSVLRDGVARDVVVNLTPRP
jgi:S1-C subfamily serine protease